MDSELVGLHIKDLCSDKLFAVSANPGRTIPPKSIGSPHVLNKKNITDRMHLALRLADSLPQVFPGIPCVNSPF